MYLKRLELHGFKSFAPRTVLEFSPGITAVVGPNGSGKCLLGSSLVTLADGRDVPIQELVDSALGAGTSEHMDDGLLTRENPQRVRILSLNPHTLKLEARSVAAFVKRTAPEHLLRIRTRSGREVTATPYHPLFTLEDGQLHALQASELQPGSRVALPRRLPTQRREVKLDLGQVLASFAEDDRTYISPSSAVRAWADSIRTQFGTWENWRAAASVPRTQLDGLLQGQGVNAAVLTRLADAAGVDPPPGCRLGAHGSVTINIPSSVTPDLARFLGLVIAEGRNTAEADIRFVNSDRAVNDEFERLARALFDVGTFRKWYKASAEDSIIFSHALGRLMERSFGLKINSNSASKEVPPQILEADADTQWAFLSGLFEGDGHVHLISSRASPGRSQPYIEYVTASATLARQVVAVLLRLGIFAILRTVMKRATTNPQMRLRRYYAVVIYGCKQLRRAAVRLSFVGAKQRALDALKVLPDRDNPNRDLVPGATDLVREATKLAGVSVKRHRAGRAKLAAYTERRCEASRGGIREVVDQIVELGETPQAAAPILDRLLVLAESDVYWDEIASVEQIEPTDPWVYDLCVTGTHNFVANNVIVHNSNIADGIRWVLGEQSMRTLRGRKSDDVIFAGSQNKAAAQMAEVGLVLDNSAAWLPSEFAEVTAARRSFRNGDSEYLVNGQRVRLKDVLLLLAQARIGHDSYTVIGQGLVDQALSQRAEERRGLFEDAAGIRQFQAQRTDAEQKLNLTQSNLARLHDIIGEIEPRLAPLAEQARRAHDFTTAREDLTRLLRVWYRRQWREALAARDRAEAAEADFAARIAKLRDALAVDQGLLHDLAEQREALLRELGELRRTRGESGNRAQTIERELAVARERLASLDRQQTDLETEQEEQRDAAAVAWAHVETIEAQVARAGDDEQQAAATLKRIEQELHGARQEQEREEARLRAVQRDVIQAQARLGAAQTELGRLQKQLGERNRVLAARRDGAAQAQRKLDTAAAQAESKRQAFEAARTGVEALVAQREQLAREIADGQAELDRLRAEAADMRRERRALADRLALLEEWRRTLDGVGDGARALLQAPAEQRPPFSGVVGQLIAVPPGEELAVETALGPFLHAVVVASAADAHAAADWLCERGLGRALFVWPQTAPATSTAKAPMPTLPKADGTALLGLLRDHVTCGGELADILARLLGDTYLVRDLEAARSAFGDRLPPVPVVTLGGELLHPEGWLRGGGAAPAAEDDGKADADKGASATSGAGMLARERELRQLPAEMERLDAVVAELEARHEQARAAQQQRTSQHEGLRKQLQRDEAAAQELARAVTALSREQERAEADLRVSQGMVEQLAAEVRGLEQEVEATAGRVAEQEQAQREASERVEDVQAEVDELLAHSRAQQEELARARTAAALKAQEVKAQAQRAEQIRAQARELETQMARRTERLTALSMQREGLTQSTAANEEELAALREQLRALGEDLRDREARATTAEQRIRELERGQSDERAALARLEVEYQRGVVESQRAREAIEALAQQIREELATEDEADPLPSIVGGLGEDAEGSEDDGAPDDEDEDDEDLSPEEAGKMRRQIDALRNRLRHLGGYDPDAPQAYEELKTRYDFLSSQVRDMEQASANLRAVIAELDATMRRQFEETFQAVNERFQRHFTTLFSGGAARLELTAPRRSRTEVEDDDEQADVPDVPRRPPVPGVEVYVQIPGKKVQDLSLLSGGERAMVSVALLFALLETNPPPFCLLDEVDAALDEANVVRFCDILARLAEQTQFIIITHNRVTMTYANAIYGISMAGDSISRVLSMQLAEAAAYAR